MTLFGDPLDLMIAVAAYFIGGVLKGAMGFGLPILAIPLMTLSHPLPVVLSVAILPTVLTNVVQLWTFRAHRDLPFLPIFLILGAVGLCFGGVILSRLNHAWIEVALGGMVLAYLASPASPGTGPTARASRTCPLLRVSGGHGAWDHRAIGLGRARPICTR